MENNTYCFIDGDAIFLLLKHTSDFYQISVFIIGYLRQAGTENIAYILLDCADIDNAREVIVNERIRIEVSLRNSGIRLLILDFPTRCRGHLEELLPHSIWIDSNSAGFFGKELKRIAMTGH